MKKLFYLAVGSCLVAILINCIVTIIKIAQEHQSW